MYKAKAKSALTWLIPTYEGLRTRHLTEVGKQHNDEKSKK